MHVKFVMRLCTYDAKFNTDVFFSVCRLSIYIHASIQMYVQKAFQGMHFNCLYKICGLAVSC